MHQVHDLIQSHGDLFYLIVFAWTALEGETFVLFAGFFAQKGVVNVWALFASAWLGTMFGDQMFFLIGRNFGTKILERFPKLKPKVDRALGWLEKYAVAFILTYRFMYGVRNVSGVAVGLSHLPWKRFTALNTLAAFMWAVVFVGGGYLFGDLVGHMHQHQEEVEQSVQAITLSVAGLFVAIVAVKILATKWHKAHTARKGAKLDG